ncbi:hypothetical protein CF15_07065 [Pyrodictium occultum]|uniref:Uncharacterized protein n=1 Tax=Pyrodictium occultum TaxID=2309 RepID=A0A0V8RWP2_PYROC|nr:hypothetical protein [Pyrodictium occultum]KSW12475.1 hypothetical protein CF15_07065 [Pyrodictium occultum]
MNHRSAALALAALAASAAALALLAGFATTQSPLSSFHAVGGAQAPNEPISLQQLGSITISPAAGSQGVVEVTTWLKITRHSDVDYVKLELSLENIEYLERLFRYLAVVVEVGEPAAGSAAPPPAMSYNVTLVDAPLYMFDCWWGALVDRTEALWLLSNALAKAGVKNANAAANRLWRNASYAVVRFSYGNSTAGGEVSLAPENSTAPGIIVDSLKRGKLFAYVLDREPPQGARLSVYMQAGVLGPWRFERVVLDSRDYGVWLLNGSVEGGFDIVYSALNWTLSLDFYDASGRWLFSIWWRGYYTYVNKSSVTIGNANITVPQRGRYNWIDVKEGATVSAQAVPVQAARAGQGGHAGARVVLGFDSSSGWSVPEAVLVLDNSSWLYDGGRAAVLGARVYYEAREGVLFDSVPLVINARVVETG